ncbi:MAG: hypothetical protein RIT04_192 [Candidatus Parcubacteria bacterium]
MLGVLTLTSGCQTFYDEAEVNAFQAANIRAAQARGEVVGLAPGEPASASQVLGIQKPNHTFSHTGGGTYEYDYQYRIDSVARTTVVGKDCSIRDVVTDRTTVVSGSGSGIAPDCYIAGPWMKDSKDPNRPRAGYVQGGLKEATFGPIILLSRAVKQ